MTRQTTIVVTGSLRVKIVLWLGCCIFIENTSGKGCVTGCREGLYKSWLFWSLTAKVMSNQSVYLTTLFLGMLSLLSGKPALGHSLSPETDNSPSWIRVRERMTVANIIWSISMEKCCRTRRGSNPRIPNHQSDASDWATEADRTTEYKRQQATTPLRRCKWDIWTLSRPRCTKVSSNKWQESSPELQ